MNRRFKLLIGMHSHGGTTFKQGDVIVTGTDLVKIFGEKFEDLGPSSSREDVFADIPATPSEPKGTDLPGRVASPRKASPKGG